jgi:hypothetical protein|tara:strand:- start:117 stop:473 length:357 start_codon:yes stop_codon:yes gene_type:complete
MNANKRPENLMATRLPKTKAKAKAKATVKATATPASADAMRNESSTPPEGLSDTSIQLQDLVLVTQIIQICSSRGAFNADELKQVGDLYTKLVSFLQATGAIMDAKAPPTPEVSSTEK